MFLILHQRETDFPLGFIFWQPWQSKCICQFPSIIFLKIICDSKFEPKFPNRAHILFRSVFYIETRFHPSTLRNLPYRLLNKSLGMANHFFFLLQIRELVCLVQLGLLSSRFDPNLNSVIYIGFFLIFLKSTEAAFRNFIFCGNGFYYS